LKQLSNANSFLKWWKTLFYDLTIRHFPQNTFDKKPSKILTLAVQKRTGKNNRIPHPEVVVATVEEISTEPASIRDIVDVRQGIQLEEFESDGNFMPRKRRTNYPKV